MKNSLLNLLKRVTIKRTVIAILMTLFTTSLSYAQCTITGTVYASSFGSYSSCDSLIIANGGKLVIDQNLTIPSNIDVVLIKNGGQINWNTNSRTLTLPANTSIIIENTSTTTGTLALYASPCNNTKRINIGDVEYAACTGQGNVCIIFDQLIEAGGTVHLDPDIIDIGAIGNMVCLDNYFPLTVTIDGYLYDSSPTYLWEQISNPIGGSSTFNPSDTVQSPEVTVTTPGTYVYRISVTSIVSECDTSHFTVSKEVEVVVLDSPESDINLQNGIDGTETVCQGSDSPIITFTNNESSAINISYNINGTDHYTIGIDANSSENILCLQIFQILLIIIY